MPERDGENAIAIRFFTHLRAGGKAIDPTSIHPPTPIPRCHFLAFDVFSANPSQLGPISLQSENEFPASRENILNIPGRKVYDTGDFKRKALKIKVYRRGGSPIFSPLPATPTSSFFAL